ncbi:hypothetical protein UPYG_G00276130 [Umbra pygmaea]|uniref:Vitellogenin domain-containing protein n=1 Tax=Umbra pygmaea TaxID=75934 RepID=A0ABD0WHU7_UMBPY
MGSTKLSLILLLSTFYQAYAQDIAENGNPTCLLAKRYKSLHKYQYHYEAESLNAVNGASNLKNGPKSSCKVEIEVLQSCSFILRTTGCIMNAVVDMDSEGNQVFGTTSSSEAFAAAMEKHPLKFVVEGAYDVKLYPEEDESKTILNIKRGIISALAVPLLEEDNNKKMPTIHGICKTAYTVNAREDIATDVTINRDLSKCDHFSPQKDHTSPLALISGMHYPLSKLIRSSQTCNYKFDNKKKHMTSGSCTENHILLPFSYKGEYGFTNVGKQSLTLLKVSTHNERVFNHNEDNFKGLPMEAAEDKSVVQDRDAVLAVVKELAGLTNGERRAHLFQQLVGMVRGLKEETLNSVVQGSLFSGPLIYQVLAQCGTPECSRSIMSIIKFFSSLAFDVNPIVFAMGLVPNPSAMLVNDMLDMAKNKQSKTIMYAMSNIVKRFYKAEGKVTPEIKAVAEFAAAQLGDCSGDKEKTFLVLRVVGNMATAMGAASPSLKSAVIQCVNQPSASPQVQQAAIQVFRQTSVPEEGRQVLMQVVLNSTSGLQKRVAAYLVLMKEPQDAEIVQLVSALTNEEDHQVKGYIISHLTNILTSTTPETKKLRENILNALQGNEVGTVLPPLHFSRNYRIGSVEGNVLFEDNSYLPSEVMLEMTLKALGYDLDMVEVGLEGKGLEPTVEALFGKNGFFPDTVLRSIYFISDLIPVQVEDVFHTIIPVLPTDVVKDRMSRQNFMTDISNSFIKLQKDLKAENSPEAMVYLRLLGNELGYLNTQDMAEMMIPAAVMIEMLKMLPTEVPKLMRELTNNADFEVYGHYIFMDNRFSLPTATGVPLKIALSGTFTPGFKGGLDINRDKSEVSFMPSAGIEFVTQFGCHIPEYVLSGLEMHTSLYHESGLRTKLTMTNQQFKLTLPAPQGPTKLISITNKLYAVSADEVKAIPSLVVDRIDQSDCTPFFSGMTYCTTLQYSDASTYNTAPYFPLTGDSKFAVELHPTGDVTEYTATIGYELLREGDDGEKVDTLKMVLKAEGGEPVEATATLKYNRMRNVLTTDIQIPDLNVEAGFRMGLVDGRTKGKGTHSISIDLINKNIPTLSLVGRAKIEAMKNAMLQFQLLVPSMEADATITANLKRSDELLLELESVVKLPETNSVQKISVKYDHSKIVTEFKSDMNSAIKNILPQGEEMVRMVNDVLEMKMGQTDMKVHHILTKSMEATNNYLEKYGNHIPYMQNLRVPEMPEISLPEKLFLNAEATAAYYFSNEYTRMFIPVPFGGLSSVDLNFIETFFTPQVSLPQLGLEFGTREITIPEFVIPHQIDVMVPVLGKAEVSVKVNSNFYSFDGSASAGKDAGETQSYSAKFDLTSNCPLELLSINIEGSGLLAETDDSLKANVKTSVRHKLINASFSIMEVGTFTDQINFKSSSKIEATSPLGLSLALEHNRLFAITDDGFSGDNNLDVSIKAGLAYGKTAFAQHFVISPFNQEAAKIDSSLNIDSTILQVENAIVMSLVDGDLSVVSKTKAFEDILTNTAELSFKDNQLSLKCDTNARALGMKVKNQAEALAGRGAVKIKMETKADHSENEIYSLLTAFVGVNGLAVYSDATVKLFENNAAHKASLTLNKDGLVTNGTTTLQGPFTMENTFNAGLDASKGTISTVIKGAFNDMQVENANDLTITLNTLAFNSKANVIICQSTSYTHDITLGLQDYTATVNVNNDLKLMEANLVNDVQLKADIYKIDLTGGLKAAYAKEELKHTYEIRYADLTANVKCSTTGRILGAHMSQNTELEMVGLAAWINNDVRFNSQPFRFDNTIRAKVVPFDFNLDDIFTADGDLTLYGKHSAQLYGKFVIKAQPLAIASSHECRASVTHKLDNGFSLETTLDKKMDMLLSPNEQEVTLTVKSKVNNHALNQDVSAYNKADGLGLVLSGTLITSLLDETASKDQEFTISGFVKYDKNTESQTIYLPFLELLPAILDSFKNTFVSMAEDLLNYINNEEFKTKLEALPQHLSDFVADLKLEDKAFQLKQNLFKLSQEYEITLENLESFLINYKTTVESLLMEMASRFQEIVDGTKELIVSGLLSETAMQKLNELLIAIDKEYEISTTIVAFIDAIGNIIKQIDLQKLQGSSIAFLHNINTQFDIKEKLVNALSELKQLIENFDITKSFKYLRDYISSLNLEANVDQLIALLPKESIVTTLASVKEFIQDSEIIDVLNSFHANLRKNIIKYDINSKVEVVLEKIVNFLKLLKIEETIQVLANNLKTINFPGKVMQMLEEAISYLKATEIREMIDQLNLFLHTGVKKLKSFDYNAFVDESNQLITEFTSHVNKLIKALEIPQKLEAFREFVNFVISSAVKTIEHLREVRVADMIKNMIDVVHNDVIKEYFIDLSEEFENQMIDLDAFFGDLKLSYLPTLPEITIPEFTFQEITLPALPKLAAEKLLESPSLQIPEIKLPPIPREFTLPCFGKLYSEIKINTPTFSIRSSAELQNTTILMSPQFSVVLSSKGTSSSVENLNYNFESHTRVAIAKLSRVFLTESLKFTHSALAVEHQSLVTIYGFSSQGSAKTTVKATTAPYTANFVNNAVYAIDGGLSSSMDTTYNHNINLPTISFTSEASLKQNAVAKIESLKIDLTFVNDGTFKVNSDEGTNKCKIQYTMDSGTAKLKMSSDTDTEFLKMQQSLDTVAVMLSHLTFSLRSEAEGPAIKKSLLVASGKANLKDFTVELKANHESELVGSLSGILNNSLTAVIRPTEIVFDFKNKGNTKLSLHETLVAKIDLQNDYTGTIKPEAQMINTVALARFNQYKYSYNFTGNNNEKEAGIFATVNGDANFGFLKYSFNIPEFHLPFTDINIPATSDVNLYDDTILKYILDPFEQSLDVDAKILYQKSQFSSLGNLITEISLKSSIFNLNANAGLYAEEDLIFRLGATTTSEMPSLKAKLDCTTSLTTKRGLKLATTISIDNFHIAGNHDSTIILNSDNKEAAVSVANVAKIDLLNILLESNQQLVADIKNKVNVAHTLMLKGDYYFIKSIGKVEVNQSLKLEGASDYISVESNTKANINGTLRGRRVSLPFSGTLDSQADIYLNADGLRSTSKIIAYGKIKDKNTTVLEIALDKNMAVEASGRRVYGLLKFDSSNEANYETFNTKGKHVAQANIDFVPWKTLTTGVEIDMSQRSNAGDIIVLEKIAVDLKCYKQRISATTKMSTPVYATDVVAVLEIDAPVIKATLKSSATSAIVLLDYDMDASFTVNVLKESLGLTSKFKWNHTDLNIDIQNAMSVSDHTLNMDITSPTFTDANFRYTADRYGVIASISNPSSGLLGLQVQNKKPSQLITRLYSRYPSDPEIDVEILVIRATAKVGNKVNLEVAYNTEASNTMLQGLKEKVPAITSTLNSFSKKYQIFGHVDWLKRAIINFIDEAYTTANSHASGLSQLSILFRNTVVQYQKAIQLFLDAAVKFTREHQFTFPGSEEMTTLPKVLNQLAGTIGRFVLEVTYPIFDIIGFCIFILQDLYGHIQISVPFGNVITGDQALIHTNVIMKDVFSQVKNLVNNMDHLDMGLVELGKTLEFFVEKAQMSVDNLQFDCLDDIAVYINSLHGYLLINIKNILETINTLNMEQMNSALEYIIEMLLSVVNELNLVVTDLLQQATKEDLIQISGGKLEINHTF